VAHMPIDHFDGLDTFDDLPRDGRCVADYWFWRGLSAARRFARTMAPRPRAIIR
jgi:hypothetical protein